MERSGNVGEVVRVDVGRLVGDCMVARIDEAAALRCWCPEHLEHLLEPPADRDDAVATLRWAIAHTLDGRRLDDLAQASGVAADRIDSFMRAPADQAGELLTFAEAARLARFHELRLEDREMGGELDDARAIASPYLEAAGLHYAEAVRRAVEVRDEYRAANPDALEIATAGDLGIGD